MSHDPREPFAEDEPLKPEQFVDSQDRIYTLELTVGLGRRVLKAFSIDLLNAGNGKAFQQLANRDTFLDVLWMFVEPICKEGHHLDRDAFENSLDGAAITAAGDALIAAIVGFSPPSLREGMRGVVKAIDDTQREAMSRLVTSIESGPMAQKIDADIDQMLARAAESMSGTSATSSPLSSAPRRKPTRSAG